MFSNLILKLKLREAAQFVCDREKVVGGGGVATRQIGLMILQALSEILLYQFWRGNILAKKFPPVPR